MTDRIAFEQQTVELMIGLYCRRKHKTAKGVLCDDCCALLEYARTRLEKCPYGQEKSACRDCPVHCYSPRMRERIREVMRYAGPRLLLLRPWAVVRHWLK